MGPGSRVQGTGTQPHPRPYAPNPKVMNSGRRSTSMSEMAVVEPGLQGSSGDASGANGAQAGDGAENALHPVGWGGVEAGPAGPPALASEGAKPPAPPP